MGTRALAVLAVFASCAGVAGAAPPRAPETSAVVHGEQLRDVMLRLAARAGLTATVAGDVTGTMDGTVSKLKPQDGIRTICAQPQLTCTFEGRRLTVSAAASAVVPLTVARADDAARFARAAFPHLTVRAQRSANALLLTGTAADVQNARAALQGVDVRDPLKPRAELLAVRALTAGALAKRLRAVFRSATFTEVSSHSMLVVAPPPDLDEIKRLAATLDAPTPAPVASPRSGEAVRVSQRPPVDVARALEKHVEGVHASVSGSTVLLVGAPEAVARAKALVAEIDVPAFADRYTTVYRIRTIDASSLADLLRRSFRELDVTVDATLNALAVTATAAQHLRIADAIAQLEPPPNAPGAAGPAAFSGNGSSTEVVTLKSYVPGSTQGGADATTSFTQALQVIAPDVRVVQLPTPGHIALVGPPPSVRTAREFLAKVDVVPPLVVLDTEILELDENVAKNLGLQLGVAAVSTTFTEMQPPPNPDGTPGRLGRFQAFSRTPVSFSAQLNLLIQNGKGRVLADPRITTLSGRTASIRAGDTISILTTTAGNAGTIATTQVQSFQTGVQLDITPVVDSEGGIMVALHPVVNSLIGTNNGVPEISTRDTQTTVHLRDDETLVIGGLIQETDTRTTSKVPLLGDIPLVGRVFRNDQVNGSRNELIIVVTPHIVKPGSTAIPGPAIRAIPSPAPLPTLPPNTKLPLPAGQLPPSTASPLRTDRQPPSGETSRAATRALRPNIEVSPTPNAGPPASASAPASTSSPNANAASTPAPVPSAFGQLNVFTFGTPPQNNFAKSTDPVQIFYATLSPTVVANDTTIRIAAITTTNVTALKLQIGTQTHGLASIGEGQWQARFPFPTSAVPPGQTNVTLSLIASRADGTSSTVPIPISVSRP
jgi:type II secretory pathway component GspD/PulD (secretin)